MYSYIHFAKLKLKSNHIRCRQIYIGGYACCACPMQAESRKVRLGYPTTVYILQYCTLSVATWLTTSDKCWRLGAWCTNVFLFQLFFRLIYLKNWLFKTCCACSQTRIILRTFDYLPRPWESRCPVYKAIEKSATKRKTIHYSQI